MPSPPPAKKRRKTASGSAADTGTHRTTRSQRPGLSIEIIAKVTTFANYDDGDAMNICLAVGRKESAVIRYTCLRNNLGYLEHCLKTFTGRYIDREKMSVNIPYWIDVNTDWRKLCTKERTEDDELSAAAYKNEEGGIVYRTDPLIIFNNPAVAIDFGIVDVLRHLVEEIGIDINSYAWNGYGIPKKYNLLLTSGAITEVLQDPACFNYLISLRDINVSLTTTEGGRKPLWARAYDSHHSYKTFRAMVEHPSFDANRPLEVFGRMVAPLFDAFRRTIEEQNPEKRQKRVEKFKVLLDVGADPELSTNTMPSPLDCAKIVLRRAIAASDVNFNVEAGENLIYLMEEKVAGGASPSSSMAVVF